MLQTVLFWVEAIIRFSWFCWETKLLLKSLEWVELTAPLFSMQFDIDAFFVNAFHPQNWTKIIRFGLTRQDVRGSCVACFKVFTYQSGLDTVFPGYHSFLLSLSKPLFAFWIMEVPYLFVRAGNWELCFIISTIFFSSSPSESPKLWISNNYIIASQEGSFSGI